MKALFAAVGANLNWPLFDRTTGTLAPWLWMEGATRKHARIGILHLGAKSPSGPVTCQATRLINPSSGNSPAALGSVLLVRWFQAWPRCHFSGTESLLRFNCMHLDALVPPPSAVLVAIQRTQCKTTILY